VLPPVSTYSIVARCPITSQLGVAVQSHYFAVGAVVPWARAGVGAVATQGFAEIGYGPSALALMASGTSAADTLARLRSLDDGAEIRQVAIVDAEGGTALHTGARSVPMAGGIQGDGYAAQGNLLASETTWQAMAEAFEGAPGELADRLLIALEAGEREGGDLRGRKSAALLVVSGERSEEDWQGRLVDVRVDEHSDPLPELRRLVNLAHAYGRLQAAQEAVGAGDLVTALARASEARRLAPSEPDLPFWTGVALANSGRPEEAEALLREVFAMGEGWRELASRLRKIGMLPAGFGSRPR